jgi:hypothetical protein
MVHRAWLVILTDLKNMAFCKEGVCKISIIKIVSYNELASNFVFTELIYFGKSWNTVCIKNPAQKMSAKLQISQNLWKRYASMASLEYASIFTIKIHH